MNNLLTTEDKIVLQRVSRILNSYGMKDGTLETEGFDYFSDFADREINVEDWTHFSNNYSVDVPPMIYPILDKIIKYCQKKFYYFDIDTGGEDVNYARVDVDIDTKEQDITVNYWYSYYSTSDGYATTIDREDDDALVTTLNDIREISDDNFLTLRYNGSGDSGYIESSFEEGPEVPASVEDFCYRFLENTHGGWEINEGSQGQFVFNMKEGTVTLEHQYNTEETNDFTLFNESFA